MKIARDKLIKTFLGIQKLQLETNIPQGKYEEDVFIPMAYSEIERLIGHINLSKPREGK